MTIHSRGRPEAAEMASFMDVFGELREMLVWYESLDPTFKFLFALPFIVAAAGLLGDWLRKILGSRP